MRAPLLAAVAALLALPALGGCLEAFDGEAEARPGEVSPADVGHDPGSVRVTGVERVAYTIPSFDETPLDAVVYAPLSPDALPDGSPPRWGLVVFLHGWGVFKEQFEGPAATGAAPPPDPTGQGRYTENRLEAFAANGLIAAAYDARGFGRSGGTASVAGPAELADLGAVIDFVRSRYATNGLVGLVGTSYGGGTAYQAWADDPRVTTAVPMYGWVDLYEGLVQGNVPKGQWAALLAGESLASGRPSPLVADWVQKAATRSDLGTVRAQMDARSALPRMAGVDKPLLVCQGMQETLFPQADLAWRAAGGFTRAVVFTGGHGADPEECWARALDWSLYFLAGHDTGVHAWPALATVDAAGGGLLEYPDFPAPAPRTAWLRSPGSLATAPSNTTFAIEQRLLANPFLEPSAAWDLTGLPTNPAPGQFRQDPTAAVFESEPASGSQVLLGAPVARLALADPGAPTPFQVTGLLYQESAGGRWQLLSRAAHAALGPEDLDGGALELRFWWTKADLAPGDRLVLVLGANDPSTWMPLPADYSVEFTGASTLELPFFEG